MKYLHELKEKLCEELQGLRTAFARRTKIPYICKRNARLGAFLVSGVASVSLLFSYCAAKRSKVPS